MQHREVLGTQFFLLALSKSIVGKEEEKAVDDTFGSVFLQRYTKLEHRR